MEDPAPPLLMMLLVVAAPILTLLATGAIAAAVEDYTRKLMSEDAATDIDAIVAEQSGPERPAKAALGWTIHSTQTRSRHMKQAREALSLTHRAALRRLCLMDAGFGLCYIAMAVGLGKAAVFADDLGAFAGLGGFLICLVAVLHYLLFRNKYRLVADYGDLRDILMGMARALWWTAGLLILLLSLGRASILDLPETLRWTFGHTGRLIVGVGTAAGLLIGGVDALLSAPHPPLWAPALLIAGALAHLGGLALLTRHMTRGPGLHLLILRVFGRPRDARFTFDGLMKSWAHFGHHYTISDIALNQHQGDQRLIVWALLSLAWAGAVFLACLFVTDLYLAYGPLLGWPAFLATMGLSILLPAWGVTALRKNRLRARFVATRDDLDRRLVRLDRRPRRIDLRFRSLTLSCFGNTWFPVVAALTRRSDVVLIDLRGYARHNAGCQREVDFLFDAVPLDRLLILIDEDTSQPDLKSMLDDRFRLLQAGSPNRSLSVPQVNVFLVAADSDHNKQAVLDWLIDAAVEPGPVADAGIAGQSGSAPPALVGGSPLTSP